MAKNEVTPRPTMVVCAYCGKRLPISETCSYGEYDKKHEIEYFCNADCAFAKLFGIIRKTKEFLLGLENAR